MAAETHDGQPAVAPEHIVQFYESDGLLCEVVAGFLIQGLRAGEPVAVIATEAHRRLFRLHLGSRGIDVDAVESAGGLTFYDARETLDKILVGDMPDWERFRDIVGRELETRAAGGRIHVYGEMVDLLWQAGNAKAAIRLEEMWNELGNAGSLSLLCAYLMGPFYKQTDDDTFRQICAEHAHVGLPNVPAEIEHRRQVEKALRESLWELRRAQESLRRLQAVTASLSEARTQAQVLDAVVTQGIASTGALAGDVFFPSSDGRRLELARAAGPAGHVLDRWASIPMDASLPMTDALRRSIAIFLDAGEAGARYPEMREALAVSGCVWVASLPLVASGLPIGVLVVVGGKHRPLDQEERSFLEALAHQCAQALERARLYDAEARGRLAAEAAQHRSAFLADAGALLSSSLDFDNILSAVGRLAVPRIADWCLLALASSPAAPDGQLIVVSPDPARAQRIRELHRRFPPDPAANDPSELRFLGEAGFESAIVAPLIARGRSLGAIILVSDRPERSYAPEDHLMAEELARRAATAIDNARLYREAREADRRKDEFLAMLGHELRNPLSPILTALELMKLNGVGGQHEQSIIERQVRYLVRLVDDLLDVSRITRGKVELRKEATELWPVVSKALETASPLFEERSQKLSVAVPREGLLLDADPLRLGQVVTNLFTNAAKYTGPRGHITVEARREDDEVVLSVRDDGVGIPPEVLPKIFDAFVQGDRIVERSQGGLGIGLTLARSLVEIHGGTIAAHSAGRGQGSEFVVRLPARIEPAMPRKTARAPGSGDPTRRAGGRILIVDDNVDAAEVLALALRRRGFEVAVAHDGPQALRMAQGFVPSVALLDIGLPVMDGYDLARELRRLLADKPPRLIALTGYGQSADREKSRAAGFDVHMVKPVELAAVVALLDESPSGASAAS